VNGDVERLTPFWDWWVFGGGPLLQLFDGSFAGVYNRKQLSDDRLELWFVEVCLKGCTELFRIVLDEERKLAKLLPAVFEWECCPIIVGGSESRVYLGWDAGPSEDVCDMGRKRMDAHRRCAGTKASWGWFGTEAEVLTEGGLIYTTS
jgi:hypothetical protein